MGKGETIRTAQDAIRALEWIASYTGILSPSQLHITAIERAVKSMKRCGADKQNIAILGYHVRNEAAEIFPDKYTQAALKAGIEALRKDDGE